MGNFRLVILDYAKTHLEDPSTKKILNDVIVAKQKNYERTDPNYVVMDKHDMIGTHYLVYDVSHLYQPKLVLALRTTFEDRAQVHRLKTPIQDLIPHIGLDGQKAYESFKRTHPVLADCNSWFVDPGYSLKNSGLRLSDIGYAMVYAHVSRFGFDHIIGCTNEKYHASRWVENVGSFKKGYQFKHPVLPDPHLFIIVESFNKTFLQSVYQEYRQLFDNLLEILPASHSGPRWAETKSLFLDGAKDPKLRVAKRVA